MSIRERELWNVFLETWRSLTLGLVIPVVLDLQFDYRLLDIGWDNWLLGYASGSALLGLLFFTGCRLVRKADKTSEENAGGVK